MSVDHSPAHLPPTVNTQGLPERKLLEAQLLTSDIQLKRFDTDTRARLVAKGQDAAAVFKTLAVRRDEISAHLKKLSLPATDHGKILRPPFRRDLPLWELPIVPAKFHPGLGLFGFGSSGSVQTGPATDNTNVIPQSQYPLSGEIFTTLLGPGGNINFDGDLNVGPDTIPQNQYDPEIKYFWLRNWTYLVPFPAPTITSTFTYRFDVNVLLSLFSEGGIGTFMSFVSVGESANLQPGQQVVVNKDAGWPMVADLSVPNATTGAYNGRYGFLTGHTTVQGSFVVAGGHVPAVAIVLGVAAGLPMMEHLRLFFPGVGDSGIAPSQNNVVGRVSYYYQPQFVLEP